MSMFSFVKRVMIVAGLVATFGLNAGLQAADEIPGLISEWKFDEGSGITVKDTKGANDIKDISKADAKWVEGVEGKAVSLPGDIKGLEIANNESLMPKQLSFSIWIKLNEKFDKNAKKRYVLFHKGKTDVGKLGANLWLCPNGTLLYYVGSNKTVTGGFSFFSVEKEVSLEKDTWYHITVVHDGKTGKLFLNGNMIAEHRMNCELVWDKKIPLYIGIYPGTKWGLPGAVDEITMYNRALTKAEVKGLYEKHSADSPE